MKEPAARGAAGSLIFLFFNLDRFKYRFLTFVFMRIQRTFGLRSLLLAISFASILVVGATHKLMDHKQKLRENKKADAYKFIYEAECHLNPKGYLKYEVLRDFPHTHADRKGLCDTYHPDPFLARKYLGDALNVLDRKDTSLIERIEKIRNSFPDVSPNHANEYDNRPLPFSSPEYPDQYNKLRDLLNELSRFYFARLPPSQK